MPYKTGDNNYGPAKWMVDPTLGAGTHQTIQAAVNSASAGDTILVRANANPYIEDVTMKAGVNLTGFCGDGILACQGSNLTPNVIIKGNLTAAYTGNATLSGILLQTNGSTALTMSGSNSCTLNLVNSSIYALDGLGMSLNNSSSSLNCYSSTFRSASTNALFTATNTGGIDFENCTFQLVGSGMNTIANGRAVFNACDMPGVEITTSATGAVFVNGSYWQSGSGNALLTQAGTNTCEVYNTYMTTSVSSNPAFQTGSGCILNIAGVEISSAATNVFDGVGTINYGDITFMGTGSGINTTTKNAKGFKTGAITAPSINFGGSSLSSYVEQGSYSPAVAFGGASVGVTYATQNGNYTRIGNVVFFTVFIILSSKGSSTGLATISLPIASGGNLTLVEAGYWSNLTLPANFTTVGGYIQSSVINVTRAGSAQADTGTLDTEWANNSAIGISGFYYTS